MTRICAVIAVAAFLSCAPEFHVSTSGSDRNPGNKSKPFKTPFVIKDIPLSMAEKK